MLPDTRRSRLVILSIGSTLALCVAAPEEIRAEVATEEQMQRVCQNWLAYMIYHSGNWAGDESPQITGAHEILSASGDMVMAHCFSISPQGHVVVPVLMELPPIKAYSEEYGLDVEQTVGFPQLLREVLEHRLNLYIETYGSLEASQPPDGDVLFDRVNRQEWDRFLMDLTEFQAHLRKGGLPIRTEVGPLLTTAWHQGDPYNNFCPMGDGGRCVVGCVATATAQIMNYHRWPPIGVGDHTYDWDGDDSCDPNHADGAGPLYADFSNAYDWPNMPDHCDNGCSQEEQDALAELCYEVGVAFEMDYGVCGSGTQTYYALDVLPTYFRYDTTVDREDRDEYTPETWFDVVKGEINADRPILYRIVGHAIVCDGWRDTGGQNQYHINYGWGGPHTEWYTLDNIYGSQDPMEEYLIRNIKPLSPCPGDIDGDGDTDHADLGALLGAWDSQPGDPHWNPDADLDGDGHVHHGDLGVLLADWGCQPYPGMVFVPAGEFEMGDPWNEGDPDELPVHDVYLSPYHIDKYEVTNQQYCDGLNWAWGQGGLIEVIGGVVYQYGSGTSYPYCDTHSYDSDSRIHWDGSTFIVTAGKEDHPMVKVSWYGAAAYCNWRSAMQGKPLCYDLSTWTCNFGVDGYRLPTEAEREKAAAWDPEQQRHYRFGEHSDGCGRNCLDGQRANYLNSGDPYQSGSYPWTTPVGFYNGELHNKADFDWPGDQETYQTQDARSYYGCYDLSGNVWEWCNDWYSSDYYGWSPYNNPRGPASGLYRALRDGSWTTYPYDCRSAYRHWGRAHFRNNPYGFRCALGTP